METRSVPSTDDEEVVNLIFKAACLQAGTTPEAWMQSRRAMDEVGLRVGTMTSKFNQMSDEDKISGVESIKTYLTERGR